MSESVSLCFPLGVLQFLVLHLDLSSILSLFLCMVLESVLISFFYRQLTSVLPAKLVKEIVFSPLYILASFVKDKVSIGAWIYLWAFYFVPLIYISLFVPVPYCHDDCSFVVQSEVRQEFILKQRLLMLLFPFVLLILQETFILQCQECCFL